MRIHSDFLTQPQLYAALHHAQAAGHVSQDIHFVVFTTHGSRSRVASHDVQLGTYDKTSGPTRSRHYKNSGTNGADSVWAATYDEWGWFLSAVFSIDADAIAGPYKSRTHFNEATNNAYVEAVAA